MTVSPTDNAIVNSPRRVGINICASFSNPALRARARALGSRHPVFSVVTF